MLRERLEGLVFEAMQHEADILFAPGLVLLLGSSVKPGRKRKHADVKDDGNAEDDEDEDEGENGEGEEEEEDEDPDDDEDDDGDADGDDHESENPKTKAKAKAKAKGKAKAKAKGKAAKATPKTASAPASAGKTNLQDKLKKIMAAASKGHAAAKGTKGKDAADSDGE